MGVKKVKSTFVLPYAGKFNLQEALKGEVISNEVKFPKAVGEKHPFSFSNAEETYNRFGLAKALVDKHLDFIISPQFSVTSKVKKAEVLITNMIQETGFTLYVRDWAREGFVKGNGYMEFAIEKDTIQFKVISANNMYNKRNKKGEIVKFNQWMGDVRKMSKDDIIDFEPNEIAYLPIAQIGDCAYGFGILQAVMQTIENIVRSNKDAHILQSRKANNPIVIKVGTIDEPATQQDVDAVGAKLEYLNNLHEWCFDHKVDFSVVNFGDISEKFMGLMESDKKELYMGGQVPAVLMGDSQQNEGIAKVQIDTFERRCRSFQEQMGRIIEQQIFKPFLKMNGIDAHVEIVWGQPSEEAVNERVAKLTTLLQNQFLDPVMRAMLQRDLAQTLGYDEKDIDKLPKVEDAVRERETEKELQQPEIPGEKPGAMEKAILESWSDKTVEELPIRQFVNIVEYPGFNYKEFVKRIIQFTNKDEFVDLKAVTESQLQDGMLSESEVAKLRKILSNGFKNNSKLIDIENKIREEIPFKDRLKEGRVVLAAEMRPSVITRTETVRLANEALVDVYKENKIEAVRWLTSVSDRTCTKCMELDGRIFKINELAVGTNQPPLHVNCRCALLSVVE